MMTGWRGLANRLAGKMRFALIVPVAVALAVILPGNA